MLVSCSGKTFGALLITRAASHVLFSWCLTICALAVSGTGELMFAR